MKRDSSTGRASGKPALTPDDAGSSPARATSSPQSALQVNVRIVDLPKLKPFIQAAHAVVERFERYGLEDERLGGDILTLETELSELFGGDEE